VPLFVTPRRHTAAVLTPSLMAYVRRPQHEGRCSVKFGILFVAGVVSLCSPLAAQAQGIPDGITHGAYVGNQQAGPVGAVVGGAVGGVIGGVEGLFGIGPTYVAYPSEEAPPVYRHRHWARHSYRHLRHDHAAS
jgi:hypothetical protein